MEPPCKQESDAKRGGHCSWPILATMPFVQVGSMYLDLWQETKVIKLIKCLSKVDPECKICQEDTALVLGFRSLKFQQQQSDHQHQATSLYCEFFPEESLKTMRKKHTIVVNPCKPNNPSTMTYPLKNGSHLFLTVMGPMGGRGPSARPSSQTTKSKRTELHLAISIKLPWSCDFSQPLAGGSLRNLW